jgi:hypothetical protein
MASSGNVHLDAALRSAFHRIGTVEKHVGVSAIDTNKSTTVNAPPSHATFEVSSGAGTGRFTLVITNPAFASPSPRGGSRTSLYHRIEYSPKQDFSSGVTTLPPSQQTHFNIFGTPSSTLYFRLSSSIDGVNWNIPVTHPAVTA